MFISKEFINEISKNKAMSEETAYIISDMLVTTATHAVGKYYNINGIKYAAKTGTTNYDAKAMKANKMPSNAVNDLWTVGYNTEYAIGPGFEQDYENEHVEYYSYRIYPDQKPVDRSRGMCDRMVKGYNDELTVDWDGSFVSVEIQNDTIVLRDGWLR